MKKINNEEINCPKHKINEAQFNNISRFQNNKMADRVNAENDDNGSHVVSPPPPYCRNPGKNIARCCMNKSSQLISSEEKISESPFGKTIPFVGKPHYNSECLSVHKDFGDMYFYSHY